MIYENIDLYKYFGLEKSGDLQGILHVYAIENSKEINVNRLYPGMLIIPGGGYEFTSAREMEPIAIRLLSECIQSFTLEYSCGKNVKYPTQLIEGYLALKYIEENAQKYNIRKSRIGIIGFSAGAHLCGLLSNLFGLDDIKSLNMTENIMKPYLSCYIYPVVSSNANIAHNPSFYSLTKGQDELIKKLSLENVINEKTPKSFIFGTHEDSVVTFANSLLLATKFNEYKVNFELHIFSKGEHGLSLGNKSVFNTKIIDDVIKNDSKWFDLLISYFKVNDFEVED